MIRLARSLKHSRPGSAVPPSDGIIQVAPTAGLRDPDRDPPPEGVAVDVVSGIGDHGLTAASLRYKIDIGQTGSSGTLVLLGGVYLAARIGWEI